MDKFASILVDNAEIVINDETNVYNRLNLKEAQQIVDNFNPKTEQDWIELNWASTFPEIRDDYPHLMEQLKLHYKVL